MVGTIFTYGQPGTGKTHVSFEEIGVILYVLNKKRTISFFNTFRQW